jgi:large conductance mechanosensitive channel
MSFISEFKQFAIKGNMIDMAVGIIMGAAFGKIVGSLVQDVLMPPLGKLLGNVDFKQLYINLGDKTFDTLEAAEKAGAPVLKYGLFLNNVVDFLIIAFAVFMLVRAINRVKKAPPPADPTMKDCPYCLSNIPIKATRCPHCTSELK